MADQDRVAIEIDAKLARAKSLFTTACCIYRVPHEIRQLNEHAYTTEVVSIGPFHHRNEKLLKMEGHKQVYCQHFIDGSEVSLDTLVSCVRELEPLVRSCYSDNMELGVDELVEVILVDCGFIIELFLRKSNTESTSDGGILSRPWLVNRISLDLLLLENQIPFFVFERLYNLVFASLLNGGQHPSFLQLAFDFFSFYKNGEVLPPPASSTAHFTDLLRTFYLQPYERPTFKGQELILRYSASELKEAGVKFTVNESSDTLLDLEFSGRILKIPPIIVKDGTEIFLRNMVALEQYHYPKESYISGYIIFLDHLINADKDVDVLVKHGIIFHCFGDNNSVAEMFNRLAKNILVTNFSTDYLRICDELNAYYEDPWHTKMATLRRDYCNTPWTTVASIAGIVLLILTIIQTACSILPIVLTKN